MVGAKRGLRGIGINAGPGSLPASGGEGRGDRVGASEPGNRPGGRGTSCVHQKKMNLRVI